MKSAHQNGDAQLPAAERIAYLIAGFLQNTLTEAEHDELDAWVIASEENTRLFEELTDEANIEAGIDWHKQLDQQKALNKIKESLGMARGSKTFLRSFWPYVVAASLIIATVSIYFLNSNDKEKTKPVLADKIPESIIHPARDQAVLTLANGRTIILDSNSAGLLAKEGNVTIKRNASGEIIYTGNDTQMKYNLVSIPRGGQYKLILGDGTKVWLNAESSIKFPAGFALNKRQVELRGEAYFEVEKNTSKPFIVKINTPSDDGGFVEVLGTHFNINSYGDEELVKTTLIKGAVRFEKEGKSVLLKPGQQAQSGINIKIASVNTEEVIAWKDGLFLFRDATIKTIGAQIARWYDLDVEYKGEISYHFNAAINRNEPLKNLLKLLEGTKRVRFTIEGKRLIIEP